MAITSSLPSAGLKRWIPVFALAVLGPVGWALLGWCCRARSGSGLTLQAMLLFVLIYPVLEEIVFRGILQPWLQEKLPNRIVNFRGTLAIILTSIAFACFHLVHQPPHLAVLVFLPSLALGYLRLEYNSLLLAIAMHCYYNAGFLVFV